MCLQSLMKCHHCLFKIFKEKNKMSQIDRLRITKGTNSITELAPSPYFWAVNIHIVDMNVFAKFDECSSY